jgi:hypothetical protein
VYAGQPTIPQFPVLEPVAADNVGVVTVYLYLIEREAGSRKAGTLFKSTMMVPPGVNELLLIGVLLTK